jgi:diketogulonate reductase-like aldo/keto reductase
MPIPTLPLNDGTQIPSLAFGTGTTLLHHQDAQVMAILESAIRIGFTLFDGAQKYKNEAVLGAAIKASESAVSRSELFIITKYAPMTPGDTAKTALYKSLEKLGLEYVDLYLVHAPNEHMDGGGGGLREVWKVMEECKMEGLARSIGVSNFGVGHLLEIVEGAQVLPAVNQVSRTPHGMLAIVSKQVLTMLCTLKARNPSVCVGFREAFDQGAQRTRDCYLLVWWAFASFSCTRGTTGSCHRKNQSTA